MHNASKTSYIVRTALLMSITVLLAATPLGYVYLPFIGLSLTIMVLPVALGGLLLGPPAGIILGLTFGITSLIKAPTEALGQLLLGYSPFMTALICILPRLLVGVLAGLCSTLIARGGRWSNFTACAVYGGLCSLVNTVGFVGLIYLFCHQLVENAFGLAVWSTTLVGGLAEAVLNALLAAAIVTALAHIVRPVKRA